MRENLKQTSSLPESADGSAVAAPSALLVLLVAALAALLAAPAQAAPTTIAEWGHGAGKVNNPYGVAVEHASGDFYVAESSNFRVSKFDSAGDFQLAWGYGVADGVSEELQVCGPATEARRCFATNFARGGNPDNNLRAESVAVDNDPASPSYRDVYVGDSHRVSKFTPSGQPIFMVGRNVNKTKREEAGATQAEKDLCTAASGDTCRSGDSGSGENEFSGAVLPLAVGSSGTVWVGDKDRLVSFDSDGAPGAQIALSGAAGDTTSLALDSSGDFYLKSDSLAGIRKLHPDGTPYASPYPLDEAGNARTVALDEAGNVFVGDGAFGTTYVFKVYDPAGELVSRFGAGQVIGTPGGGGSNSGSNAIAVGQGAGQLYVASSRGAIDSATTAAKAEVAVQAFPIPDPGPLPDNQEATDILPTTATLKATLNPEGHPTHYSFQYGADKTYGQQTPEGSLPASFENSEIEALLNGLIPDTTYHFRVVASDEGDSRCPETAEECTVYGPDTTFTTRTAVGIEAQWATDIAAHDATLHAELDPLGAEDASWRVQYGTSVGYGSQSEEFELPPTFGSLPVAVALSGLAPATTYHYRFLAKGEQDGATYTVPGPDRTFTTQLAGLGFTLPDNRAWEMVSPADKHGGRIAAPEAPQGGHVQGAANGEALAYLSYGSLEANPQGSRLIEQSSELSRRGAGGAWSTADLTAPHTATTPFTSGSGLEYKLFSTNLERALMEPRDCTPLSPQASERTPYLRENSSPPTYTPLVTAANVGEGTPPFGGNCLEHVGGAVGVLGATPDMSHIVLGSSVPLLEGAANYSLYEWTGGVLEPLSVPPGGEQAIQAELGSGRASVQGAISEDGSRFFWTAVGSGGSGLYLRDTAHGETTRLDEEQPGAFGTGAVAPLFQAASTDGSVALFTDTQNLTEDANEEGADLYRWVAEGAGGCEAAGGCLEDLSAGVANFGESAEVQGLLPGIAEDGSSAYLVARGVLATNEGAALDPATGEREHAAPGQLNLYVWREGQGMRFVATLAEADTPDWGGPVDSNGVFYAYKLTATASPSGRYLAFMSKLPLTGYDNRDAAGGERAQEVFRYDSQTDDLTCVSCDPSGARPHALVPGPDAGQLSEEFDPNQLWGGVEVAAVVPEAMKPTAGGNSLYRPRFIQDDGRVFFNAADSLVAADSNGDGDVYEYEPTGVGSCSPSSGDAGTATLPGGCVSLISSGTAEGTSAFIDASEGARDVFFYSPAQLSVTDTDNELDVYDAREAGEPARLEPIAECQGEACQPPASPPAVQTPASASFRGPGNVKQKSTAPSRCAKPARRAKRLSHRARKLRRGARRAQGPKGARLRRRAAHYAKAAKRQSRQAKHCRRAARRSR